MDGIELQVYGHLLDQFWSPLTNDLDGPYGADTLENRMRFPMDVLEAIRKRVGSEFIVGLRYTADEAQKGGITPEEGLEISKRLAATGQIDFLNVIRGRIHTDPAMTDVIPVQGMKSRRIWISRAKCARRRACRPSMPPGSPMWRRRAMRCRRVCWIWSA